MSAGKKTILLFLTFMIAAGLGACGKSPSEPGSDAGSIGEYITTLQYDGPGMLNVQDTGATDVQKTEKGSETVTEKLSDGREKVCVKTTYDLQQNFGRVAILRPTSGVIYPGALVKANGAMMDGVPEPVTLKRAPATLSIDLPGMGDEGTVVVDNPTNSSVSAAVSNALEWWNANAYQEGYVNAANSVYNYTSAYSSQQMAMDLGLNMSWATGDFSGKFQSFTSAEKSVITASFQQAFYTVTFDSPEHPEDVFASSVRLGEVEAELNAAAPPAYVSSVVYGRIIVFKMENTSTVSTGELEAAFNYGAGLTSASGDLKVRYDNLLKESKIEVITIGGNASVASELVNGDLKSVITGSNAVYSRENPGVPIAYTVRYLKDHSLAKMGYTTEYTTSDCSFANQEITVTTSNIYVVKDCDGIGGQGEFSYAIDIYNTAGKRVGGISGSKDISSGNYIVLSNRQYVFKVPAKEGEKFTVKFRCSEWDKDILGNTYRDDRMNNESTSYTHYFRDGAWTSTSKRRLTLGSGDCQVWVEYSFSTRGV